MQRVLHLLPTLGPGGGSRAALALAGRLAERGHRQQTVLALRVDRGFAESALPAEVDLRTANDAADAAEQLAAADLVHVHYWHSPEIRELLLGELPPCRLVLYPQIAGDRPPQLLDRELLSRADLVVASSPYTAGLASVETAAVVPLTADLDRLGRPERRPHRGFNVGYLGTVDSAKMHPDFVDLCARIEVPDLRFIVAGAGDLAGPIAARAAELGISDRFELLGYVDDLTALLGRLDVLGYPLREGNYSSTELVLIEAMHMGVPPVVLPYGGAQATVIDEGTGLVVSEDQYPGAIERLWRDPQLRDRLGRSAREWVRDEASADRLSASWGRIHAELLEQPRRGRAASALARLRGAEAFVATLGEVGRPFAASLHGAGEERARGDAEIAGSEPPLWRADGGLLDYRRRFPEDAHLRLWSGLVLAESGHRVPAAAELGAAIDRGIEPARVRALLRRGVASLGDLAGLDSVLAAGRR